MDIKFLKAALKQAEKAKINNEVPIGAVVVKDNIIIGKGYNRREEKQLSFAHAEIYAIEKACKKLKSWRLDDCEIYVTHEPCLMCYGAIINARIKNLYFGSYDDKREDRLSSILCLSTNNGLNHNLTAQGGILEEDCKKLLKDFFNDKRAKKQQ